MNKNLSIKGIVALLAIENELRTWSKKEIDKVSNIFKKTKKQTKNLHMLLSDDKSVIYKNVRYRFPKVINSGAWPKQMIYVFVC